jgi:hypothetical protein
MAMQRAIWIIWPCRMAQCVKVCSVMLSALLVCQSVLAGGFDHDATRFELQGFHRYVDCEVCHVNGRFQGTPMDCFACHGGSTLIPGGGKNLQHLPTTNACADCHRPDAWDVVTRFDHSHATGTCVQCHNGAAQSGKPARHVVSNDQCESCHNTFSWAMARFDHSGITAACSSCHNGTMATGKHPGHLVTNVECDRCHTTRGWLPAHFMHQGAGYPGNHAQRLECNDCHQGNTEQVVWRFPAYQPDCAGCHANRYEMNEHVKVNSPRIYYNVSELRDCSGACHVYTDSTFSSVQQFRTGQHRVNSAEFGD